MSESSPEPNEPTPPAVERRATRWDAIAAIIAAFIGFLALIVAGYTAYIQRHSANILVQQVRAQVWPYLIIGNSDRSQSLIVINKGVGPAVVRNVEVRVDGKPMPDWNHVVVALGMPVHHFSQTTVSRSVLSPGEVVQAIRYPDKESWQRFRAAAFDRVAMDICFCSTLGECWTTSNRNLIGPATMPLQLQVQSVHQCPRLAKAEAFNN